MTAVRIYAPDGPVGEEALVMAPPLDVLAGRRLIVLDNGKPQADVLMGQLASRLAERAGVSYVGIRRKGSAATPCEPDLLDEIVAGADLVVTGTAD